MTKNIKIGAPLGLRAMTNTINDSRISSSSGLTLIELMVVITIIGIIMLIAIPNFARMQQRARIRAAAQEVAQDFRQIRERALSKGITYQVTFDTAKREYTVTYADVNGVVRTFTYKLGGTTGGFIKYGCTSGASGNPPEGSVAAPGNNGIDFPPADVLIIDSRGGATNGVIYITDNREDYAVGVNSLGKIKVYRFGNGNWY